MTHKKSLIWSFFHCSVSPQCPFVISRTVFNHVSISSPNLYSIYKKTLLDVETVFFMERLGFLQTSAARKEQQLKYTANYSAFCSLHLQYLTFNLNYFTSEHISDSDLILLVNFELVLHREKKKQEKQKANKAIKSLSQCFGNTFKAQFHGPEELH